MDFLIPNSFFRSSLTLSGTYVSELVESCDLSLDLAGFIFWLGLVLIEDWSAIIC